MAPGDVSPAQDALTEIEVLHQSDRARIARVRLLGLVVVRKEPLGPDAERRVRHELTILERLRGLEGVAQLVDGPSAQSDGSIVLADAGDATLRDLPKPLAGDELLALALALARAVAAMHGRGVMHRDISPANVVVSSDGAPCLVDFALATSLGELRVEFVAQSGIDGTLAYLAPEQTGRTGRPVDHRADLYALGATLYELATGGPPFGVGDPLRLMHDLLARVPTPPATLSPSLPAAFSLIVLRLLEKEPDNRYQSADGVVYDLERVRDAAAGSAPALVRLGERDLPLRLLPPSRLVGRDDDVAALQAGFEDALAGRCRGLLLGGAPGVGKTALVDELRPLVTAREGWFVAGKFDLYRRDLEFDGVRQALRVLGRLLLAEPEAALAEVRARILRAEGSNVQLLSAVLPEFAALLRVPPDPGDPLTAQARAQRAAVTVLRAIASDARPLVVFLDDLQWAGPTPLGVVDMLLSEEPVAGLFVVGAYRDVEADAAHPLAALLSRWRTEAAVRHLHLENLQTRSVVAMVADMLRVDPAAAAGLASAVEEHSSGNPYEVVELLNTLRRAGVLTATAAGWRWDEAAVRVRLGPSEVARSVAASVPTMPPDAERVVEAMACLGGRAEVGVLGIATGTSQAEVDQALAPALDEGLLVLEPGERVAVRFRHDRIREAVLSGLDTERRGVVQLDLARRLVAMPELYAVAAEQYLPVIDAVEDATERRQVVAMLHRAAAEAGLIGDHAMVEALMSAALRLVDVEDTAARMGVHTARHAAVFSLGRLEDADEEYDRIERLSGSAAERPGAAALKVWGLTYRVRMAEAIEFGVASLRELGIAVPPADVAQAELDDRFGLLYRWLDDTDPGDDVAHPELADPALIAAIRLMDATMASAYFADDHALQAWLSLESVAIWLEHGPSRVALASVATAAFYAVVWRGDVAGGLRALQRLMALGEARGWEPGSSQARFVYASVAWHHDPLETGVRAGRRAHEGLVAAGELALACYAYHQAVVDLLDCVPSLEAYVAELEGAAAYARRTANEQIAQSFESYRWLAGVLTGETQDADLTLPVDRYAGNPLALFDAHVTRAIAAALLGHPVELSHHSAAAMRLRSAATGIYPTAWAQLLRGLALADQARAARADERGDVLAELDEIARWLAARAADAPENLLHLQRLLEAERAWAIGDFRGAAVAFDRAQRMASQRARPWHRAMIAERAARFALSHGLDHAGHRMLADARRQYAAWGAAAKVEQLDWAYASLEAEAPGGAPGREGEADPSDGRTTVTAGTIDLLGILAASQALSSETSLDRLRSRVVQVLGEITGATDVHMVLWSDEQQQWLLPVPADGRDTNPGKVGGSAPVTVLRYVERVREPLVVADARRDDRFARDPYFAASGACSLLALPVLSRGALRAVLVLENRLMRGAFTAERLDAVKLIAGQLAVSLDNAQVYAELAASRARIVATADETRRRIVRDLHDGAQNRLVQVTLTLELAERARDAGHAEEAGELFAQAVGLAQQANADLRELSHGILPSALARNGLAAAVEDVVDGLGLPLTVTVTSDRFRPEIESNVYFVVAEALTNMSKHARTQSGAVTIWAEEHDLHVDVRDDGVGGADIEGGGLRGIADRIAALGGRLRVESPPGGGTRLTAEVPLER